MLMRTCRHAGVGGGLVPNIRAKAQVPSRTNLNNIDSVSRVMLRKNLTRVKTKRNVSNASEQSLLPERISG